LFKNHFKISETTGTGIFYKGSSCPHCNLRAMWQPPKPAGFPFGQGYLIDCIENLLRLGENYPKIKHEN
jgi:hypothetical protein